MSDEKKKKNKVGCYVVIGTLISIFIGAMLVIYAGKFENEQMIIPGIILIIAPFIILPLFTLLPAKLRGVDAVPRKERVVQVLMMLFVVIFLSGFVTAIIIGMTMSEDDNPLPLIISGCAAGVGFIGVIIMAFVNKRVTGNDSMTVKLYHDEEESREITEKVLNKLLKPEERLSAEERKRELERIEKNTVGAMTKEQVEEYENKRHLF